MFLTKPETITVYEKPPWPHVLFHLLSSLSFLLFSLLVILATVFSFYYFYSLFLQLPLLYFSRPAYSLCSCPILLPFQCHSPLFSFISSSQQQGKLKSKSVPYHFLEFNSSFLPLALFVIAWRYEDPHSTDFFFHHLCRQSKHTKQTSLTLPIPHKNFIPPHCVSVALNLSIAPLFFFFFHLVSSSLSRSGQVFVLVVLQLKQSSEVCQHPSYRFSDCTSGILRFP